MKKRCDYCNQEKDSKEFGKESKTTDGLRPYCKECIAKREHTYYVKNKEQILKNKEDFYLENREAQLIRNRTYYINNKNSILEQKKNYYLKNKDYISAYNKEYYTEYAKKCYKENSIFKLKAILRTRLNHAIKNNQKIGSAISDLGCSIEYFKKYFESKFYDGMTWNNYGTYWEIDHVVSLYKFNLTNRRQFLKACNYKNLQPLTIEDHKKKTIRDIKK